MTHDDDEQRLGEGVDDLVQRVAGCSAWRRTECPTCMPTGSCFWISGMAARTPLMTSSELAVGSTQMPMNVAFCPSKRTSVS